MEINFKAQYIRTTRIKIRNKDFSFMDQNASFVSLNPKDKSDVLVIKTINKNWNSGFLHSIYNNLDRYSNKFKLLALTSQRRSFKELNPDKILGIALVENKPNGVTYLDYLQTNPQYMRENTQFPKYKNIGTAILNCIKQLPTTKCIKGVSVPAAFDFYLKNDFRPMDDLLDDFAIIWKKDKNDLSL